MDESQTLEFVANLPFDTIHFTTKMLHLSNNQNCHI
jgi:hypothetical protein